MVSVIVVVFMARFHEIQTMQVHPNPPKPENRSPSPQRVWGAGLREALNPKTAVTALRASG